MRFPPESSQTWHPHATSATTVLIHRLSSTLRDPHTIGSPPTTRRRKATGLRPRVDELTGNYPVHPEDTAHPLQPSTTPPGHASILPEISEHSPNSQPVINLRCPHSPINSSKDFTTLSETHSQVVILLLLSQLSSFLMMMSMFSAFDALSFEHFSQKFKLAFVPSLKEETTASREAMAAKKEEMEKSKSTPTPPPQHQRRPEAKRPRFAPELDGLHCFETIVRY